jgi:predicted site-specific integrase-resolvase
MPTRVAIYARVSTDDKTQDPENRLLDLLRKSGEFPYEQ